MQFVAYYVPIALHMLALAPPAVISPMKLLAPKITATPAAVIRAIDQLNLPMNRPIPTTKIAMVAIDLAMPPDRVVVIRHIARPITSLDAATTVEAKALSATINTIHVTHISVSKRQ